MEVPGPFPAFKTYRECRNCALGSGCRTAGIPTTPATPPPLTSPPPPLQDRALLIVGEAPGYNEDLTGRPFVGGSGHFLRKLYIAGFKLDRYADVYLSNACRCRPANNSTPTASQVNRCRPHLIEDIRQLQALHSEVVILCVGSPATRSILSMGLTESFSLQGRVQSWGWAGTEDLKPCRVFTTFHPANLISGRNPSRFAAVKDHLRILESYLSGNPLDLPECPPHQLCPAVPSYKFKRLSVDIETYGACHPYPEQTEFHPIRALHWDNPKDLVVTASVCWRNEEGELQAAGFNMWEARHRARLASFIRNLEPDGDLIGMNIKFDIMWLRAFDPQFLLALNMDVRLTDLAVLNYLHSEQRPERSLKALAPLFRITKYDAATSLKHHRYKSRKDPDLMAYNVKDSWSTLLAVEYLEAAIAKDYPDSEKLSPYSRQWYSNLLWTCIRMEEDGVAYNAAGLDELDYSLVLKSALLYSEFRHKHNIILAGTGSAKAIQDLYLRAMEEAGLTGSPKVVLTEKKREVSTNQENANLFLEHLSPSSPTFSLLKGQQQFEAYQKIITSYTRPMLHGSKKNPTSCRLLPAAVQFARTYRNNAMLAFPSWFPVPSQHDSGKEGGTMQGRITSKFPACQTMPKVVKKCLTSRYDPGFLIGVDLSQIELRVGALMSGDSVMMKEYWDGVDRHTNTAKILLRHLLAHLQAASRPTFDLKVDLKVLTYTTDELLVALDMPRLKFKEGTLEFTKWDVFRQGGKTTNFLILFRGGGFKLRSTLATDLGIDLPLPVCEATISEIRGRYPEFDLWQVGLIESVKRTGRLILPLTGQSRLFLGSPAAIEATYTAEICNLPIQCPAANIMLDIQHSLRRALDTLKRKVYVGLNIYDAIYIDGPISQYAATERAVERCFASSEYLKRLQDKLERQIPLGYDLTVILKDGVAKSRHLQAAA